jgi:hypothetical protein
MSNNSFQTVAFKRGRYCKKVVIRNAENLYVNNDECKKRVRVFEEGYIMSACIV